LTSDLVAAGDGSVVFGAVLTSKGMIVADLWSLRQGERFTLLAPRCAHDALSDLFKRTLPPRLARVNDRSLEWRAAWILGGAAPERLARATGHAAPSPGRVLGGAGEDALLAAGGTAQAPFSVMLLGPAAEVDRTAVRLEMAGGHSGDAADLAAVRLLAGWPTLGREIDEKTLPQEVRFDEIGGVSYTKGCYTGQETVARVHFRGHVNRSLRGVVFEESAVPGERALTSAGKEVGAVRTTLALDDRVLALGMLRREVPEDAPVQAGGRMGRVAPLPFDAAHTGN
jgi:folate-binding protein YgfZ